MTIWLSFQYHNELDNGEQLLKNRMATIYCNGCSGSVAANGPDNADQNANGGDDNSSLGPSFDIKSVQPGDIQLENNKMRLLFDEKTGFLKTVTKKQMGKPQQCAIRFGAYRSAQYHSGAYLFKPDTEHESEPEKDVLEQYKDSMKILITSGALASDVTVLYGPFMSHTVRILNSKSALDEAIYIENNIDFEAPPKNRETEMYMRFVTDIENGYPPQFYSDANGFQYQFRVKVPAIGAEGNYYPITSGAFMQDANVRLTLLTNHAQGAASLEPGEMEVMLDRRTLYDDYRGMGEGIVDSRLTRHKFYVLLESFHHDDTGKNDQEATTGKKIDPNEYQVLSQLGNHLSNSLNYPLSIYFIENTETVRALVNRDQFLKQVTLLHHPLPCDTHLMTLRTLTETNLPLFPSRNALLVVHKQAYNCQLASQQKEQEVCGKQEIKRERDLLRDLHIEKLHATSLTDSSNAARKVIHNVFDVDVQPNEIKSFHLKFSK